MKTADVRTNGCENGDPRWTEEAAVRAPIKGAVLGGVWREEALCLSVVPAPIEGAVPPPACIEHDLVDGGEKGDAKGWVAGVLAPIKGAALGGGDEEGALRNGVGPIGTRFHMACRMVGKSG